MGWLPWLGVALLVAAVLSPGPVVASRLVFQSPPTAAPTQPPPPPATPAPVEPAATSTPVPPEPTSGEVVPTEAPVESLPTEAPTEAPPPEEAVPAEQPPVPEETSSPVEAPEPPAAVPEATAPVQATEMPAGAPEPEPESPPGAEAGQPIINWVKFWDTMAVAVAYPWLCCGALVLLLIPVSLLYLEIKGRRRPPVPPEPLSVEERGYEGQGMRDEG